MLAELNAVRAQGADCGSRGPFSGAAPVGWHGTLEALAQLQAAYLAGTRELRHVDALGRTLGERARLVGYPFARVGENLALGQRSLRQVLRAWSGSDAHCATMMGPGYTEAALVCTRGGDGRPRWVLVMGRPQGFARPNRVALRD